MKIRDVRARLLSVPYPEPFSPSWAADDVHKAMSAVVVEVHTDAGVTGLAGGDMGHGSGPMLLEAVRTVIRPQLVGLDAFRTEHVANRLRYVAQVVSAGDARHRTGVIATTPGQVSTVGVRLNVPRDAYDLRIRLLGRPGRLLVHCAAAPGGPR